MLNIIFDIEVEFGRLGKTIRDVIDVEDLKSVGHLHKILKEQRTQTDNKRSAQLFNEHFVTATGEEKAYLTALKPFLEKYKESYNLIFVIYAISDTELNTEFVFSNLLTRFRHEIPRTDLETQYIKTINPEYVYGPVADPLPADTISEFIQKNKVKY